MPGKKMNSIKRPKVYEALRGKGASKAKAAKIANTPKPKTSRPARAKKTRKRVKGY